MNRLTNPYTTAGVALLAGLLVGLLTSCGEGSDSSADPGPLSDHTTVSHDSIGFAEDLGKWIADAKPESRRIVKSPKDGVPMYNLHEDLYRRLGNGDSVFLFAEVPAASLAYVVIANADSAEMPYSIGYVDAAYIGEQQ